MKGAHVRCRSIGFSLIELLMVVSLIVMLVALLLPALGQTRRSGRVVVCASNEHTIYQAYQAFEFDNKLRKGQGAKLNPGTWSLVLYDYYGKVGSTSVCPENEAAGTGQVYLGEFWAGIGSSFPAGITRWYNMQSGPLFRRLSQTQYEALQAARGDGDGAWAPWFAPGGAYEAMGGYQDDNRGIVWLVTEDIINGDGTPGGDKDFNDCQIKVETLTDGTVVITAKKASGNRFWVAQGAEHENVFPELPNNGEMTWSFTPQKKLAGASYGCNQNVNEITGNKIFLMDYYKLMMVPDSTLGGDDWTANRDSDGKLKFARHPNGAINVLSRDGAVSQEDPELLNPAFSTVRTERWLP